jgi:tRNA(Arg) A34 adenosine deaminase TadA
VKSKSVLGYTSTGEISLNPSFILRLPDWLKKHTASKKLSLATVEERMSLVIELSRLNVYYKTGGPFGAAIFNMDDGSLLAAGVNLVMTAGSSVLHAEMVATMAAQKKAGTYDLSAGGLPPYELVTSTEPCAMCMGAITWSGIRRLVCGARGADAEATGFDEGEKPPKWKGALERRGILVLQNICRDKAAAVLKDYAASGGIIYNPRRVK